MSKLKDTATAETTKVEVKTTVKAEQKMSVTRYLSDNPQDFYIDGLMRKNYAMDFKTKSEWDSVVIEIKEKKINKQEK